MTSASCDSCRRPGACCRGLVLSGPSVPLKSWRQDASDFVARHLMPFLRPSSHFIPDDAGLVRVAYDCDRLGADGRCSDYEGRPEMCRIFEPGSDQLCIEYIQTFRGIPIVVAS